MFTILTGILEKDAGTWTDYGYSERVFLVDVKKYR